MSKHNPDMAHLPQGLFVTYERTVRETRSVAEVTAENIGKIAALIGGSVDYSEGEPILVAPPGSLGGSPWRVRVGFKVSLMGDRLMNQNGFNIDGDWRPVEQRTRAGERRQGAGS